MIHIFPSILRHNANALIYAVTGYTPCWHPRHHCCTRMYYAGVPCGLQVGGAADILGPVNECREKNEWDVVAHTMDSHPADHCSFVDNHEGAEMFATKMISTPDGSDEMEQVMWPRHCVQGSEGWKMVKDLKVAKSDFIQRKGEDKKVKNE